MGFLEDIGVFMGRSGSMAGGIGNIASLANDIGDADDPEGRHHETIGSQKMSAGLIGLVSSVLGGGKGVTDLIAANGKLNDTNLSQEEHQEAQIGKNSSIARLVGSGAGMVSGIADIIGGALKKKGKDNTAAGWVSNIAGLIGSGAGIAQGIYDLKGAKSTKDKASAVISLIGRGAGAAGGLMGLIGNSMQLSKNNTAKKYGKKVSLAGSYVGNGIGALSGLIGGFF